MPTGISKEEGATPLWDMPRNKRHISHGAMTTTDGKTTTLAFHGAIETIHLNGKTTGVMRNGFHITVQTKKRTSVMDPVAWHFAYF